MKKLTIFFISIIVIAFIIYRISYFHHPSFSSSLQKDTVLAKQYSDSAKALLQNKPDSAILLYNKAINRLEPVSKDIKVRHLLATVYVDLSDAYLPQAKYDKVKELCAKALKIARIDDLDIRSRVLMQDGLTCYHQSQFDEALKLYGQAGVLAQKTGNRKLQSKLASNKAIIYYNQGKIKMAVDAFRNTLRFAKELNDPALISDAYINLGIVYTDQMNYRMARECYATAINYYKKNKQNDDLMKCYRNLGNVYYMMEKYAEAIDWYQKSLELAKELNNKVGIAKGYHNIGEVYMLIGDYVQAGDVFIRALKIKESIGDKASMAKGYRSLADLYFIQKNFTKSLIYHQKALQIDNSLKLIKEQAKDYVNISTVYGENKEIAQAIEYCRKAIDLAQKSEDTYGVAEDTRTLGGFYYLQKNYALAESYYQKAIEQKKTLLDQEGMASVYCQLAELYTTRPAAGSEKKQNLRKALQYGLMANKLAHDVKIPRLIADASNDLAEIYKQMNNYPKAFVFLEINKKTNDSIFNKSKTEALAFAEARWNSEKKQQQISNLEKLNAAISAQKLEEAKRHKTILFGLIGMIVLLVIAAVFYWLYKSKQREMRHQQQLSRMSMLRLQNIRNRISPHFIFNILNREISSEIDKDKHHEMIGLVKFLRRSLEITEQTSVSLAEELDFVKNYLQMEQPSLGCDFETNWEIDKRIPMDEFRIPAMILQIPVENALKHALRSKEGEKRLLIALTLVELGVLITIQDNGDGYSPDKASSTKGTGTGLKVLYQTIQLLNSKNNQKIEFDISNLQGRSMSGTKVEICVPEEYDFEL